MPPHPPRSPARFLAPIALIAFALALVVVVMLGTADSGGGGEDASGAKAPAPMTQPSRSTTPERRAPKRDRPAAYTVERGDTLGTIAEQTGVSVETIQELNPELDPQALVAGQEIKLRE